MGEEIVEVARLVADQMREHLPLMPARQIRAGRGRRQVELRGVTRVLGQGIPSASGAKQTDQHRAMEANGQLLNSVRARRLAYRRTNRVVDNHGSEHDI